MSDKKTNLLVCIVCGMCGTKDDFTPGSNNTCKKCLRVRQLEQRVRCLEERSLESAMKNMEIRMSALEETMERRVSALEEINRQKNDDDLLDRQDSVHGKESAARASGGQVAKEIAPKPLSKADLEEKINAVLEEKLYFVIGVAERDGSPKKSMEKYEQLSPHLDEKNIQAIDDYKVNLVKVFYGNILSQENANACAVESQRLLGICRRDTCKHCLNAKSGEDEWLREKDAKEGILFVHVYSV